MVLYGQEGWFGLVWFVYGCIVWEARRTGWFWFFYTTWLGVFTSRLGWMNGYYGQWSLQDAMDASGLWTTLEQAAMQMEWKNKAIVITLSPSPESREMRRRLMRFNDVELCSVWSIIFSHLETSNDKINVKANINNKSLEALLVPWMGSALQLQGVMLALLALPVQ